MGDRDIIGFLEYLALEAVKPIHMIPSTVKSFFDTPTGEELYDFEECCFVEDFAFKLYKVAALSGGVLAYYGAVKAGMPELLAVPAATNLYDLGRIVVSAFKSAKPTENKVFKFCQLIHRFYLQSLVLSWE